MKKLNNWVAVQIYNHVIISRTPLVFWCITLWNKIPAQSSYLNYTFMEWCKTEANCSFQYEKTSADQGEWVVRESLSELDQRRLAVWSDHRATLLLFCTSIIIIIITKYGCPPGESFPRVSSWLQRSILELHTVFLQTYTLSHGETSTRIASTRSSTDPTTWTPPRSGSVPNAKLFHLLSHCTAPSGGQPIPPFQLFHHWRLIFGPHFVRNNPLLLPIGPPGA